MFQTSTYQIGTYAVLEGGEIEQLKFHELLFAKI